VNGSDEPALRRFAPLLAAVKLGEQISRDVSLRQSRLAPLPSLRRALQLQSRQEGMHAALFGAALACLPRRVRCPPRVEGALAGYAARLHADLDAGCLCGSMVGLQCVFERLGAVALQPPAGALSRLGDRLVPLRVLIAQQEEAHHRLGEIWVPRLAPQEPALCATRRDYVALAEAVVEAALAEFDGCDADRRHFLESARAHLGA
jgi:hypothetical protein